MKQTKALLAGLLAGIASPASIGGHVDYARLAGSDLSRMRGDVARVGRDFSIVIKKNGEKTRTNSGNKAA